MQFAHQKLSKSNFYSQHGAAQPQVKMSRAEKRLLRAHMRKDTLQAKDRDVVISTPRATRGFSLTRNGIIDLMRNIKDTISNAIKGPKLEKLRVKFSNIRSSFSQIRQSAVSAFHDYKVARRPHHRQSGLKH